MASLAHVMLPELILIGVACLLFLLGVSARVTSRRLAPVLALAALVIVFLMTLRAVASGSGVEQDDWNTIRLGDFSQYIKLITSGIGILLVLLAWPTNADATGSASMDTGHDTGEFFALMLLSLSGVFIVSSANDIILLFLGIELASIPTYIMVSISRPLAVAQEAGVKYFFLGAMAGAVMLFGFSYLYGTTGETKLDRIAQTFHPQSALVTPSGAAGAGGMRDSIETTRPASENWRELLVADPAGAMTEWKMLAVLMLLAGFAFKIAAVPLHAYAGDVYQGAATPVTAFLAFVPKTSGFVAIIKLLSVVGGAGWEVPPQVVKLLWVVAVLTMSFGNVLGLLQYNVKRVLAYSSIAHSGYMLVGLTALVSAAGASAQDARRVQGEALQGVLFYLAAYGITNAAAFGVLMMLPSREARYAAAPGTATPGGAARESTRPATSAETFEDLAGQGRRHVGLGLAMAVSCFSLIGLPLTVGFLGKFFLIKPALDSRSYWLVIITMINAAVSAAYYLRIVATMFLRTESQGAPGTAAPGAARAEPARISWAGPVTVAIVLSVIGTLAFGFIPAAANRLSERAAIASTAEGIGSHGAASSGGLAVLP